MKTSFFAFANRHRDAVVGLHSLLAVHPSSSFLGEVHRSVTLRIERKHDSRRFGTSDTSSPVAFPTSLSV